MLDRSEGRDPKLPNVAGLSRGTIIRPETTTQYMVGQSVSDKLRSLSPTGRSGLQQLVGQLQRTGGINVVTTGTGIMARMGTEHVHIPTFHHQNVMFHGRSSYATIGNVFVPNAKGGFSQQSLPDFIYDKLMTGLKGRQGQGLSPKATFQQLRSNVSRLFVDTQIYRDGSLEKVTAGEAARLFEPYMYQGQPQAGRHIHMQQRSTFLMPSQGSAVASAMQTFQEKQLELAQTPGGRAVLRGHGMDRPDKNLKRVYQEFVDSRDSLLKAVAGHGEKYGHSLLTASQSGSWVFPGAIGPKTFFSHQEGKYFPITMSSVTPEELMPVSSIFRPQVHHLANLQYLPLPQSNIQRLGNLQDARFIRSGLTTKNVYDKSIYTSVAMGRAHAILQPSGVTQKLNKARQLMGRPGSFGIPMNTLVFADPKMAEAILGKSGAILDPSYAGEALSQRPTYTRKIKVAPSGVDMPGLELGQFKLTSTLKTHLESLSGTSLIEASGRSALAAGAPQYEIPVGEHGLLGAHLSDEGAARAEVRAKSARDVIVGHRYHSKTGELELTLLGKHELRMAQQLTVGPQAIRVGAHRVEPLYVVGAGGKRSRADILADVPTPFSVEQGKLKINRVSGAPDLKVAGDFLRYHLETVAQRVHAKYPEGGAGLRIIAKAFGGTVGQKDGEAIIEGALSRKITPQQALTNLKEQLKLKLGSAQAADAVFTELTGLEIVSLDKTTRDRLLQRYGLSTDPGSKDLIGSYSATSKRDMDKLLADAKLFRFVTPVGAREKFYPLKSGYEADIKFKRLDIGLLRDLAVQHGNRSPQAKSDFTSYITMAEELLHAQQKPEVSAIEEISRGLINAPQGVKTTNVAGFATKLPSDIASLKRYSASELVNSVLVGMDDDAPRVRSDGFYIKTQKPISLLGIPGHAQRTQLSDIHYLPSPAALGFHIDPDSGALEFEGGRKTKTGIGAQRAYLELLTQAEKHGGIENMPASSVQGRLNSIYAAIAEGAIGKTGSIRESRIRARYGGMGRLGYLPSLQAGELGIPSSRIEAVLGRRMTERVRAGEKIYMLTRRHPVRSETQLMAMRVAEITQDMLASTSNVNTEEMLYTNSAWQYLAQGDQDGDVIEAFLLSKDGRGLSKEMKALGHIAAGQRSVLQDIQNRHRNLDQLRAFGDITDTQYNSALSQLVKEAEDIPSVNIKTITEGFKDVSQHGLLAPTPELYFRNREPIARTIAEMTARQADRDTIIKELSRWSKQEISGNLQQLVDELMSGEVGGRNAKTYYGKTRQLINYALLEKIGLQSQQRSDIGIEFLDILRETGGSVAEDPSLLHRTGADSPVSKLTDILYEVAEGDKLVSGQVASKATRALALEPEVLRSKESLMAYFARMSKTALAVEALGAGAQFQPSTKSLHGLASNLLTPGGAAEAAGGPAVLAGQAVLEGAEESAQITEMLLENQRAGAQDRHAKAGSVYAEAATAGSGPPASKISSKDAAKFGVEAARSITQSKFFKPVAFTLGALAGWEAIKSVASSLAPEAPPQLSNMSQAPLPPPPMLSQTDGPTFHHNFVPETNIARIGRVEGNKVNLNVSGRADAPVDFRNLSSVIVNNYGFQPLQNGQFRDQRHGELSRREVEQYIRARMTAAF